MPRKPLSRYEYDVWYDEQDGRLYVKATALQYERVTEEGFAAVVSRKLRGVLRRDGILAAGQSLRHTYGVGEWDRAHNIADDLLETLVYRTTQPVAHLRMLATA